jgi:hypothetical protein
MQTSSPNSKKCSKVNRRPALWSALRPFETESFHSLLVPLFIFLSFSSVVSGLVAGPLSTTAFAAKPPLSTVLLQEIRANHTNSFQNLLTHWEVAYGTDAYPALSQIAHDRTHADTERYIAIMGMAKIGGTRTAPTLTPFLSDPAWMVRNATLRALSALKNPETAGAVLPLLKDPALVIRMEALSAIETLKPAGFEQALADSLRDPANYHHGIAQWVPQKSLELLIHHQPQNKATRKQISLQLISLSEHPIDPNLRPRTILALEKVSGQKVDTRMSLDQALRTLKAKFD